MPSIVVADALENLEATLRHFSEGFQTRDLQNAKVQIEIFRSSP
ncbi:hypothetical protein SS05631_c29400 [Sinorhizobium sp. CCBAU 05631]|nr:hypothetical protein SS05631_c29400 [Sinorhizobium sp. CCBAU 05631]